MNKYIYECSDAQVAMARLYFLLALAASAAAFAPNMCQPQNQFKPLKPKYKNYFPQQKEKLIYVATFTKKSIIIRPKKIRLRQTLSSRALNTVAHIKKYILESLRILSGH